jgi:hypothetical protein
MHGKDASLNPEPRSHGAGNVSPHAFALERVLLRERHARVLLVTTSCQTFLVIAFCNLKAIQSLATKYF